MFFRSFWKVIIVHKRKRQWVKWISFHTEKDCLCCKSCRKNLTAIFWLLFIVSNASNSKKTRLAKCLSVIPFGIKSILLASGSSVYPKLRPCLSGVVELFELPWLQNCMSLFLQLEGLLMKSLVVQMPSVSQECHQLMFNHEITTCAYRCDFPLPLVSIR